MANGNRLSMSHGRTFTAIALAAVGLFIVSYGIGLGNPGIIAVGVAVGVLGPALLVFTAVRSTGRQYIYGTAHVYSASPPPSSGMVGRCELHLSVFAAGIDGVAVRVLDPAVPVSKWPDDGATLPVEVVANNPRKVRVLWDKVVTHAQAAGEDLYPQYVEDLPPDLDDEFDDDLPPDEYLDDDLPPVPVGPPPTPPPNMPTGSTTIAAGSADFAPVSAPLLVEPAAAPPPGPPTVKVVAGSASDGDARSQTRKQPHTADPVGPLGSDVRAERDRRNRAYVSESYDPDDDESPEYWRDDKSDEPPRADLAPESPRPVLWAADQNADQNADDTPDDEDDEDDEDDDGPGGAGPGGDGPGGSGPFSTGPTGTTPRGAYSGAPSTSGAPGTPSGPGTSGGPGSSHTADPSGTPMAAGAGGPAVSLPLPRRRPSPHLRRPSPRQRKASDSETGDARATASGGINPVYVAESPTEPPPDWPLTPQPVQSTQSARSDAHPIRPESRPEPDYTEIVSGTVEPGSHGYGEVLTGSIVDDHAYSDRSETDRMSFDRGSFRALEFDLPDHGPNGSTATRANPRSTPAVDDYSDGASNDGASNDGASDDPTTDDPTTDDPTTGDDPFNVVPLRVGGAPVASNGTSPRTLRAVPAEPPTPDDLDDEPDDEPEATDAEHDSDPDDEPAEADTFAAEGDNYLAAPSAGLSSLGSGGFSVTLFVRELARSVTFYRDVLGLPEVDTGKTSAVLARGESRILLKRVTDLQPVDRRVVHLNLEVPDVQVAYDDLKAKGVEFVHRPRVVSHGEQLELWAATFRDPDGHAIALTHWEIRR